MYLVIVTAILGVHIVSSKHPVSAGELQLRIPFLLTDERRNGLGSAINIQK